MSEGLLYEPRSLWSIGYVTRTGGDPGVVLRLPRRHFLNEERHPITLQRVAISAVNYMTRTMAEANQPAAARPLPFYASSVINRIGISISSPFRQHYSGSQEFALASIAPKPTALPPMYQPSATTTNPRSSIWGISALDFDNPLYVPRSGSVEWDVSPRPLFEADDAEFPGLTISYMLLQEQGGDFAGNTRGEGWGYLPRMSTNAMPLAQLDEGFPFAVDPVGAVVGLPAIAPANVKGMDTTADPWLVADVTAAGDRDNVHIGERSFRSQDKNQAGSSKFTGMRIMYDQIDYDDCLDAGGYANDPKEQVATRIGTRARTRSGSGNWWWRPGAPVALVCDSMTPALVYNLPAPITLGPGDTLDVRMSFPGIVGAQIGDDIPFQIGVSLNGFAAIEG